MDSNGSERIYELCNNELDTTNLAKRNALLASGQAREWNSNRPFSQFVEKTRGNRYFDSGQEVAVIIR